MSVALRTEICSSSPLSFEHAIREGVVQATSSIDNVLGAWVKHRQLTVRDDRSRDYRVTMIVAFQHEEGPARPAA